MRICLRRREFIAGLGGTAAAWPLAGRAQQGNRVRRVGILLRALRTDTGSPADAWVDAFKQGLAGLGWTDGRYVRFEERWADTADLAAHATELARLAPDAIFVFGSPALRAMRRASGDIPIVFASVGDPVQEGYVSSLAHPGGNITGVTNLNVELFKKCFELMHSLMSPAATIAVLVNPANIPQAATERATAEEAARALGARLVILNASTPSEIESAFETLVDQRVGALAKTLGLAIPLPLLGRADLVIE